MAKSSAKRRNKVKGASAGNVHPLIKQAEILPEQAKRARYEVAEVTNPHGEFIRRDGTLVRHKAVRKVPHFETLYRSKVVDRTVFVALEWYADRLALAHSGLFKCGLDVGTSGGGSAHTHIPTTQAAMEARSDIDWARGSIPNGLLASFDGVMEDGDTFEAIGARVYSSLCLDRAKRKVSLDFRLAANYLLLGIGSRICLSEAA